MVTVPVLVITMVGAIFYVANNRKEGAQAATTVPVLSGTRDPYKWPFSRYSIWNMPIGSNARYVPANITPVPAGDVWAPMPGIDHEYIFMDKNAPLTDMAYRSDWLGDRCTRQSTQTITRVPMPTNYTVPNGNGNNSAAFIMANGRTIFQSQPLARCTAGGYATSINFFQDRTVDIFASGDSSAYGAHGGSDLSALGGSLRVGELRKNSDPPRHALKVSMFGDENYYRCTVRANCFRWPAFKSDSYAVGSYGTANNNQNFAMRMGALLAIPANVNISSLGLETEPARKLAWTLQNYGAYINDEARQQFLFNAERGPNGNFADQFRSDYGFNFEQRYRDNTSWTRDTVRLIRALHVVDNNSPNSIGGGGTPLQPLAPCFNNGIECDDPNVNPSPTTPTPTPTPTPPTPTPAPSPTPPPPSTPVAQAPYTSAIPIPGRLEAENYDKGGENVAYHDTTTTNQGGKYRTDGVDIETPPSGGYSVGWVASGEWLEYSTNVTQTGLYDLTFRVATGSSASSTWTLKDGTTTLAIATTSNTGGWYAWKDVVIRNVSLAAGAKIVKLEASGGELNIDYVSFAKQGSTAPAPSPNPASPSVPSTPAPPIAIPGANSMTPVVIPQALQKAADGTIIADFTGDGLNDVVRDINNDGQIDPITEIVIDGTTNHELTDLSLSPVPAESLLNGQSEAKLRTDSNSITIKPGPLPEVTLPKPIAYTFLVAQGLAVPGIGIYLAITKLALFASIRGKLGW